jgi:plastocyanin
VVRAAAAGATHVVVVGNLKNAKAVTFTPNTVTAAAGDTVQYQFASANHTVTQASGVDAPCKPVSNAVNSMDY